MTKIILKFTSKFPLLVSTTISNKPKNLTTNSKSLLEFNWKSNPPISLNKTKMKIKLVFNSMTSYFPALTTMKNLPLITKPFYSEITKYSLNNFKNKPNFSLSSPFWLSMNLITINWTSKFSNFLIYPRLKTTIPWSLITLGNSMDSEMDLICNIE